MDFDSIETERGFYEKPKILLIDLTQNDVIVTSGESGGDSDGPENGDNNWTGEWDTDL